MFKKLKSPVRHGIKYMYGCAIPAPLRYGKVFRQTYNFLRESQWWDKKKIEDYQKEELARLLRHAYANVPYYRRIFDERDLKPKDIRSIQDLQKLPYLTKEIIRKNSNDLIACNYLPSKGRLVTTGGSTGEPLRIYWERGVTDEKEKAYVWRQWNWASHSFRDRKVVLRGCDVKNLSCNTGKWWFYNPVENELLLSTYELTKENFQKYLAKIKAFTPTVIRAYPSSLSILCDFLKAFSSKVTSVRAILTCSETLFPWQRKLFEEYVGAKTFDHYGLAERCVIATQCEKCNGYHINPEYGITELINSNGDFAKEEEERVEIIGTGFNNYFMPLIRFKTGDVGIYTLKECSCGRKSIMLRGIEGRLQDYLVDINGNLIPLTGSNSGVIGKLTNNVEKSQLAQFNEGEVIVKIVKGQNYNQDDENRILNIFRSRYGNRFTFSIDYIKDIERTASGKYRYLIQELPIQLHKA